jgi:hypothetical protein
MPARPRFRGPLHEFPVGRLTIVMLLAWLGCWIAFTVAPALVAPLMLQPASVVPGFQLWRLLTHAALIVMEPGWFVLTLVFAVMLMPTFEARWGPWGLLRFLVVTSLAGAVAAVAAGWALLHGGGSIYVGPSAFLDGLIVAYALVFPGQTFRAYFVIPVSTRTMVWIILIINLLGLVYYLPKEVLDPVAGLAGMGFAWVYLKHGWRLGRGLRFGALRAALARLKPKRRRGMRVVDRDFEEWLRRTDDEEPRH